MNSRRQAILKTGALITGAFTSSLLTSLFSGCSEKDPVLPKTGNRPVLHIDDFIKQHEAAQKAAERLPGKADAANARVRIPEGNEEPKDYSRTHKSKYSDKEIYKIWEEAEDNLYRMAWLDHTPSETVIDFGPDEHGKARRVEFDNLVAFPLLIGKGTEILYILGNGSTKPSSGAAVKAELIGEVKRGNWLNGVFEITLRGSDAWNRFKEAQFIDTCEVPDENYEEQRVPLENSIDTDESAFGFIRKIGDPDFSGTQKIYVTKSLGVWLPDSPFYSFYPLEYLQAYDQGVYITDEPTYLYRGPSIQTKDCTLEENYSGPDGP